MSKYKEREYMNLVWDGSPDAYYIKGHVTHEQGIEILEAQTCLDDDELEALGQAVQKYGRWSCQGDAPEGCKRVLREYTTAGRGRFKITCFGVGVFAKATAENNQ